jgi:AraC family transcriptional regulator
VKTAYRDTLAEITRIQKRPPPVVPVPFTDDSMITRPWVNDPIHDDVAPMEHHVIAPTLRGDGWSEVRFGTKWIRAPSMTGGITIAPRGFGGRFDCDGQPVASNVFISRDRLQRSADVLEMGRPPELLPRLNFDDPKLFAILSLISAELEIEAPNSRLFIERLLDLLCLQLLREHVASPLTAAGTRSGLQASQVQRVTDYMAAHLEEAIGLQDLADIVRLSRFHFCHAFRVATGFTPHQWLVRLRMERARELLLNDSLTVTEVALAVGYQTPSSFAHAFRTAVGATPTAFRASRA